MTITTTPATSSSVESIPPKTAMKSASRPAGPVTYAANPSLPCTVSRTAFAAPVSSIPSVPASRTTACSALPSWDGISAFVPAYAGRVDVIRAGLVPYEQALARQRSLHEERVADQRPDTVLLLEHPSVYTAGKRTEDWERPTDGTPVVDVDRGGRITWHGPGQLVGYPIVKLAEPVDVVAYVRRLEQVLVDVCAGFAVGAVQVEGRSGAWLAADRQRPERKIASIGIRVSRGVTMHGFSLNCDPDMSAYRQITACGIQGVGATSLAIELGRPVPVDEVIDPVEAALRKDGLTG
jgi:lipoyl(octanoyl) transferase